ncbi:MAG: anti-sigma regulatory factor [Gemmatimonadales bacterium]
MISQPVVERVDPAAVSAAGGSRSVTRTRLRVRVRITSDADVALAAAQARHLARRLAFAPSDVTVIGAALHEVARNLLAYGGRGEVLVHPVRRRGRLGLTIIAHDRGPGIADVRRALRDGCSSTGRPGLGLPSARRLMDEFTLRSGPERGTIVTMRKWARTATSAGVQTR